MPEEDDKIKDERNVQDAYTQPNVPGMGHSDLTFSTTGTPGLDAGKKPGLSISDSEKEYWRENFQSQPWRKEGRHFDDYWPALRTGFEGYQRYGVSRNFEEAEKELEKEYDLNRANSPLEWGEVRESARAAWKHRAHTVEAGKK